MEEPGEPRWQATPLVGDAEHRKVNTAPQAPKARQWKSAAQRQTSQAPKG